MRPTNLSSGTLPRTSHLADAGTLSNNSPASRPPPQVVLEPDNMLNLSITSPAATVALALMSLRTNNAAVAARFQLPDTPFGLDCVRPDCITLRALGRAMVMWDSIEPSADWLAASLPPLFRVRAGGLPRGPGEGRGSATGIARRCVTV